jgi:hypothetical protein
LRLYVYIAQQNDIPIFNGAVVRGDGRRYQIVISRADAVQEADRAREQLHKLNAAVRNGTPFHGLASPSALNCRSCPCIPFCSSFWAVAAPEWQPQCGCHVEGEVLEIDVRHVQGISLATIKLAVHAGTIPTSHISAEQIPGDWLTLGDQQPPQLGDRIRIVHARPSSEDDAVALVRVDKVLTAVWRVPMDNPTAGE